ncbi:MAG: succinyldiaminopimelate transaminase [Pseudonocardia sp.]|nr:succinyldiaminopimelate transaminase [Pseudonocardia sp.]
MTLGGLPDFPWDSLAAAKEVAAAHADGIVDLSIGTPVDPVPELVRAALCGPAAAEPGYPYTWGTPALRAAVVAAMDRRFGVGGIDPDAVLPTIGSKELVAWLPTLLGLGAGDVVAIPELAYPTYEVGARLAGADVVRLAAGEPLPAGTRLLWLNSPSNPTGAVLPAESMRAVVDAAREAGAVVASDECYLAFSTGSSVLHRSVSGGRHDGLIAVHSLSKSSNLAGYRAGFVTGDAKLVRTLMELRRHAGMIVSRPVQAAMCAALDDDEHIAEQAARYSSRRARLRVGLRAFGLTVEHSAAGLYLWATGAEPGRVTVDRLAKLGVLVAPGEFYGPAGASYIRVAATAHDYRIDAAVQRLSAG